MNTDEALNQKMTAMFQAAADFALLASARFREQHPAEYRTIRELHESGAGELQVTLVMAPQRQVELSLMIGTRKVPYVSMAQKPVRTAAGAPGDVPLLNGDRA